MPTQPIIHRGLDNAEQAFAGEQLDCHNERLVTPADTRQVSIALPDDGVLSGACFGSTAWNRLHINVLWVSENLRGNGYGGRLLNAAQSEAEALGCDYIILHTFSFQARSFYERHGYSVEYEATDFLPGHSQYLMRKRITP